MPSESIYVKDVSVFLGNRLDNEVLLITTSAFDGLLQPLNIVPVEPFIGDEGDRLLLMLEVYLMTFRWSTDVRLKVQADFQHIYGDIPLQPMQSPLARGPLLQSPSQTSINQAQQQMQMQMY